MTKLLGRKNTPVAFNFTQQHVLPQKNIYSFSQLYDLPKSPASPFVEHPQLEESR